MSAPLGTRLRHVAAIIFVLAVPTAAAAQQVIAGPTILPSTEQNWQYSGIEFAANRDATLTSFAFNNQGNADTILLTDTLGNELHSVSTLADMPSDTVSVNWSLSGGQSYLLFRTTTNNSLFANWNTALPGDDDITILNSGFFSGQYAGLGGFPDNLYWSSFTNITTTAVPEPISWVIMLIGFGAIGLRVRHSSACDPKRAPVSRKGRRATSRSNDGRSVGQQH